MESASRSDLVGKHGSPIKVVVDGTERLAQLQVEDDEIYLVVAPAVDGDSTEKALLHRLTDDEIAKIPALTDDANPIISKLEFSGEVLPR